MINIKNKKNNKTILIIVLLIIAVVLAITLCILHIFKTLEKNEYIELNFKESTISDIRKNPVGYSLEEILKSFDCKNIQYSIKKDNEDNRFYEITLFFKYNLYENDKSKQEYFDLIVKTLSKKLNLPFKIIDIKKGIEIYVDSQKNIYTINGVEDYFKNNSYLEVENRKIIPTNNNYRSCSALNMIINNGWSRENLKIKDEPISTSEELINYGTYRLNCTGININYVEFLEDFDTEVIGGIKVGESFNKIQKKLGEPNFKNDKMIGYKNIDGYTFFYKDKIIVYPYIVFSNYSLENLIIDYCSGNYNGNRTNFVMEILKNYPDFKSEIIRDGVKISSSTRGIELYLYNEENNIVIYNNYQFNEPLKKYAQSGKTTLKFDEDSIYNSELSRYFN